MATLKEKTARGLMWGLINNGVGQLLNALFGILLLQRLSPSDYGKVAMLMVFTGIAGTMQDCGFRIALCNLGKPTHRDYNAVFWFNISMSAVLFTTLCLAAPLIARFFGDPSLVWLARYLFLGFFISSFGILQRAYMFINLMNKQIAIMGIVAMLISGTVGVIMAELGFAYWGLATQQVLYILVVVIIAWIYSPWRPTFNIDFQPAWKMFRYSSKILITNIFYHLNAHAFSVLLGRFYGDHSAGVYSNARKWNDMGANTVNGMVQDISQPVLTRVRDDQERYRNVFRKMLRFTAFLSFPALFGLALVAREFILCTIGYKWIDCVPLLQILCISGAFMPIYTLCQNLVISHGRSDINMWLNIGQIVLQLCIILLFYRQGITTMVIAYTLFNIVWLGAWMPSAKRIIGLRFLHVVKDVAPFMLCGAVVMVATYFATLPVTNIYLLLAVRILLAAALYYGVMRLLNVVILRECMQFILKKKQA